MVDMNLNSPEIQNEHRQDLLREAEAVRLVRMLPKNETDMVYQVRLSLGKKLVSLGHHLIDYPRG